MKTKIFTFFLALAVSVGTMYASTGALPGEFSVSTTEKVHFSKGNLQFNAMKGIHQCADGTSQKGTWCFAEHQWDYVGDAENGTVYENGTKCNNTKVNATYNGWIDLFGWGTSGWSSGANAYKPYETSQSYKDYYPSGYDNIDLTGYYANADWGVYNQIGDDPAGTWRTLTKDEWGYLFHGRNDAEKLFGLGTVNGVPGTILLPDDWVMPEGVIFVPSTNKGLEWVSDTYTNSNNDNYSHNTYTDTEWTKMESSGAVFLPAAGFRNGKTVGNVSTYGYYWSSLHSSSNCAYGINFMSDVLSPASNTERSWGAAVRLASSTVQYEAEPKPCITASGTCGADGENLTWELSCNGGLTISGTGEMADYIYVNYTPWYSYRSAITSISIGNSVTSIGNSAFNTCNRVISIKIPNSVTSIGDEAFRACDALTSIEIPNSVTSIGDKAFYSCTGLTSVTIGNSVTSIGQQTFNNCTNITSVVWKAKNCNKYNFGSQVTSFTFGNEVEVIPASLCDNMVRLTSINIPNSVTSIEEKAFQYCYSLASITCEAVTPPTLSSNVFNGVDKSIPLFVSAENVDTYKTADQWKDFNNIFPIGTEVLKITWKNYDGSILKEDMVAKGIVPEYTGATPTKPNDEYSYAFSGWSPEVVAAAEEASYTAQYEAGPCITASGTCGADGENLTWELSCNGGLTISGTGEMADYIYVNYTPWYSYRFAITSISIGNSVTSIGRNAFSDCSGLISVVIGNSVTGIGHEAFSYCSSLTSIEIPNSVTSIGDKAFISCTGLTSVTIPYSVTSIGDKAFYSCTGLTSETIPNSVTSIGSSAFCNCHGLTSIDIPNSVTSIGDSTFCNCTRLTSIEIPNSVTSIGKGAFCFCTGLVSIKIPNSVTSIGEGAFCVCTGLVSIKIPNSVTGIGHEAFSCCTGLTSVTIPNSVTSIGDKAFYSCTGLTSETIPNSVTSIGYEAFSYCSSLTSITCEAVTPPTLKDYMVFYEVDKSIPLFVPAESVDAYKTADGWKDFNNIFPIGTEAVKITWKNYDGTILKEDLVAKGVVPEYTGATPTKPNNEYSYTFSGWTPEVVAVTGEATYTAQFEAGPCITASGSCGAEGDNLTWKLSCEGVLTISGTVAMADYNTSSSNAPWYSSQSSITSVILNDGITSIGNYAFYNCTGLTSIEIPNSVTSIGNNTFLDCINLTSTEIPNSVTSIGMGTFRGCSSLTSVEIPNSVTSIEQGAFRYCSSLTSVTIPNSVTSIGFRAFEGCTSLTSVEISNSVTSIGESAFNGCSNLTSIEIPNSVTSIGESAFSGCYGLKNVILASSVKVLEKQAFNGCSAIESFTCYGQRPPTAKEKALEGVSYSTIIYVPAEYLETYQMHETWGLYDVRPIEETTSKFTVIWQDEEGNVIKTDEVTEGNTPVYTGAEQVKEGYTFAGWLPKIKPATKDICYTTYFIPQSSTPATKYIVNINGENCSLRISNEVPAGTTLQVEAVADECFEFQKWSDNETANPRTINVTEDANLTAEFNKLQYTITGKNDAEGGQVNVEEVNP